MGCIHINVLGLVDLQLPDELYFVWWCWSLFQTPKNNLGTSPLFYELLMMVSEVCKCHIASMILRQKPFSDHEAENQCFRLRSININKSLSKCYFSYFYLYGIMPRSRISSTSRFTARVSSCSKNCRIMYFWVDNWNIGTYWQIFFANGNFLSRVCKMRPYIIYPIKRFRLQAFTIFFLIIHLRFTDTKHLTKADVIFVLDSSASMTEKQFHTQLEFVANFSNKVSIGPNDVRISVITFSSYACVEFDLDMSKDNTSVINAVLNITYKPGVTRTDRALEKVNHNLKR